MERIPNSGCSRFIPGFFRKPLISFLQPRISHDEDSARAGFLNDLTDQETIKQLQKDLNERENQDK